MKSAALNSMKFKKLKRRLCLAHWQTVGLLESIWLFTQVNAIAGDIGKYSDEDIAAAIEWEGDPTELVDTLVECRLLDRCPVHRLIIHDWPDHAPTFIHGAMKSHGKEFAKQCAKQVSKEVAKQPAKEDAQHTTTLPNHTIPNQTKPSTTCRATFDRFWAAYPRKTAKDKAAKAWQKIKPDDQLLETILSAIDVQSKSDQWQRDGGQFIPHAATWLNGKRWEDQVSNGRSQRSILPFPLWIVAGAGRLALCGIRIRSPPTRLPANITDESV